MGVVDDLLAQSYQRTQPSEKRQHRISIVVQGVEIDGWEDYEIQSSMIQPADAFTMRRRFEPAAWKALPRDSQVEVRIDGVTVLNGFIDKKKKRSKDNTIEVGGRDRSGRLVQESAPTVSVDGLEMTDAIKRLADPWFKTVTLSDARNRRLRLGKGRKVPTGTEPIVIRRTTRRAGKVHPGTARWSAIEEIVSQAGLICWSSADGRELVVGQPNYKQAPQFELRLAKPSSGNTTTVKELDWEEDDGDRYSIIAVVGTGGDTEQDFGENVSSRRAVVRDNDGMLNAAADGTGRDFLYPKRLLMPEKNFDSNQDALEIALREQARRDLRRTLVTATCDMHGQFAGLAAPTIFAPNTIARVIDEEFDPPVDQNFLIYQVTYRGNRNDGETSVLELVPSETEIVL